MENLLDIRNNHSWKILKNLKEIHHQRFRMGQGKQAAGE
jgi:hypothetical protein